MRRHWLLVVLLSWCVPTVAVRAQGTEVSSQGSADKSPDNSDNAPASVEFAYCVERLLSPLYALAGRQPPEPEVVQSATGPAGTLKPDLTQLKQRDAFKEQVLIAKQRLAKTLNVAGTNLSVRTVIATLPDPVDSGLVYSFETMLQALRLGFEAADTDSNNELSAGSKGWFPDRSFLPWADRQVGSQSRVRSEVCRRSVPGLLLFRNSDLNAPRVLLVFVVGETPTSGVHGAALLNALRMSSWLTPEIGDSVPIRIIGPTFSGSAYSLRVLLESFAGREKREVVQIVSGTASGSDVATTLRTTKTELHQFTYAATTVTDADADCAYLHFLHDNLGVTALPTEPSVLEGVATLRESGTEFGVRSLSNASNTCKLEGELTLSFPMHVSMLRDAYEDLERRERQPVQDIPVVRANGLDATLGETRTALELEANPSPKTRAAVDTMLSRVLGEISRRSVRHVSIHATDVGDAVFLARRIRDIAPDVRIAFFEPDDILLHPEHRAELLGSLVVSPYPFLGISDFQTAQINKRTGFPNAGAQGLFNAVLAQRDVPIQSPLFDPGSKFLALDGPPGAQLEIWVSAIARTGLVPVTVQSPRARLGNVVDTEEASKAKSQVLPKQAFDSQYLTKLPLAASLDLPRAWSFSFLMLALMFALDAAFQAHSASRLSDEPMPTQFYGSDERAADRAIGRAKWWLYSAIRRLLFVIAFGYVGITYVLAAIAKADVASAMHWQYAGAVAAGACLLYALWSFFVACATFLRDYLGFARYVNALHARARIAAEQAAAKAAPTLAPIPVSESSSYRRRAISKLTGAEATGRLRAARQSFWQLTFTTGVALSSAVAFSVMVFVMVTEPAQIHWLEWPSAVPSLTLYVLRTMPLLSGVSPATPLLLCLACVYICAVGRMARLLLAHSLSRIAPHDGENDLASTPIRLVLYPNYDGRSYADEGFTQTERDLLNSIWRPIAAKYVVLASLAVLVVPAVLFWLKPVSTIELPSSNGPLRSGLGLGAVLIGVIFVQLLQYWTTLTRLLQRTAAHPLAPAFAKLPDFARDTIEGQLSGSSDILLRWVSSARLLDALVKRLPRSEQLLEHANGIKSQLERALRLANTPVLRRAKGRLPAPHDAEASALAELVISAAVEVSSILPQLQESRAVLAEPAALTHTGYLAVGQDVAEVTVRACIMPPASSDLADHVVPRSAQIWVPPDAAPSGDTQRAEPISDTAPARNRVANQDATYEQAQAFVATVVALLIQRHVRQLRYFMSTLVGASIVLLLAVSSYPFEPYRLLLSCMWVIICAIVSVGIWIYIQLNRDPLMRRMSNSQARGLPLSSGVIWRMFTWAILPLLSIAAAQFPNFANMLLPLISPFLRALR